MKSYDRAKTGAPTWFMSRTNGGNYILFRTCNGVIDRILCYDNERDMPDWVNGKPMLDNKKMSKFFGFDNRELWGEHNGPVEFSFQQ